MIKNNQSQAPRNERNSITQPIDKAGIALTKVLSAIPGARHPENGSFIAPVLSTAMVIALSRVNIAPYTRLVDFNDTRRFPYRKKHNTKHTESTENKTTNSHG